MSLYKQKFNPVSGQFNLVTSVEGIDDAIAKKHTQNTDTKLAEGTANEVSVTDIKDMLLNIMLNAFRIAQIGSLTIFSMVKGFMDEFQDESGIDLDESENQKYDSNEKCYNTFLQLDDFTKLLLHLDNNVIDDSNSEHTVTNNNVTFSSSEKKFGTHSALFNGSDAVLYIPADEDFALETNTFTIDFWIRFNDLEPSYIFSQMTNTSNFVYLGRNTDFANSIHLVRQISDVSSAVKADYVFETDIWYHIALVRNGTNENCWQFYINGTAIATSLEYGGNWNDSFGNYSGDVNIGKHPYVELYLNAYIDEFRWSNGIARWTSNFTPPSSEYGEAIFNIILQSEPQIATSAPSDVRIVIFEEDIDEVILNTDLKAYVSRDGGTTFTQVTLADEGGYIENARVLSGVADVSGQPSGTNVVYKIVTDNLKVLKIHGVGISWK